MVELKSIRSGRPSDETEAFQSIFSRGPKNIKPKKTSYRIGKVTRR